MMSKNQKRLRVVYQRFFHAALPRLYQKYPAKLVATVQDDAWNELNVIITKIPSIGEKNLWQSHFDFSVITLGIYRALKQQRFTLQEIGTFTNDFIESYILSFAQPMRWAYRQHYFSLRYRNRLQQGALSSQQRQYTGDWVYSFVNSNGSFDFGVDIHECAIAKLYKSFSAEELTPHLCQAECNLSSLLGLGLTLTRAQSEGTPVCTCRWKRGAVTQSTPVLLTTYSNR